ncbi:MAG: 6-phosphofructokinase [Chloroflexi bacterium]|nr:6-phosphofructokinase [Chloroflexota bacterium]
MKTAIVVSGGDAPGINAAIDAYARLARESGGQVVGAQDGFAGLLAGRLSELDGALLSRLSGKSGSILRSSRAPVLSAPDAGERLRAVMRANDVENLLLFGGDGSLKHALPLLERWGAPCVAMPTTIDNDITGTDYTLGHDSACNFALAAVEGIRATADALPGRIFLLETLGGHTGYLALAIAHASGADVALLPEYAFDLDWLAERVRRVVERAGYALVVLCEFVPGIDSLRDELPRRSGIRVRYTALGHAQRGADTSHYDRTVARDMSGLAWQALKDGLSLGAVVMRHGKLTLREGLMPPQDKPAPDYARYARINGL